MAGRSRASARARRYALCIDDPFDFACATVCAIRVRQGAGHSGASQRPAISPISSDALRRGHLTDADMPALLREADATPAARRLPDRPARAAHAIHLRQQRRTEADPQDPRAIQRRSAYARDAVGRACRRRDGARQRAASSYLRSAVSRVVAACGGPRVRPRAQHRAAAFAGAHRAMRRGGRRLDARATVALAGT